MAILTGRRVARIDASARSVATDGGETFGYGTLIWAAGGHARRLSCAGHDLVGILSVRSRADVDRMMRELPQVERFVMIGGGHIWLEAAAVLAKPGKSVIVLEAQDRVLARVAGEMLSRFYESEHRAHGVTIALGTTVSCFVGEGSTSLAFTWTTGRSCQPKW